MYKKTTLDNGLRIITEEIPFFKSATIGIWVDTGSRNEIPANSGISHFIEHMIFKGTGTKSATDIAEIMDGVGGQLNAFTEKEHTCFYARVLDRHVELALDLLSDMLLNSVFDAEELNRERSVILDEIRLYDDSPEDIIFDMFNQLIWKGHSLGRPVLGTTETVENITRGDILSYMAEHYTAEHIVISATGNIEHENFVKLIEKFAGKLPAGQKARALSDRVVIQQRQKQIRCKDSEQAYVIFGREGVSHRHEQKYCLTMLDSILGGSMSSRIFQEIREKRGLAYSVGSFTTCLSDTGLFGIFAGTSPDTLPQVTSLIIEITEKMKTEGATAGELERAREQLKGSLSLALESTSGRMIRLAKSEMHHGRLITHEEIFEKLDKVTLEDIYEMARTQLDTDSYSATVLGPVEENFRLPILN